MREGKIITLKRKEFFCESLTELRELATKYMSFMPGVTEILFYYVLLVVVKPFLVEEKIYTNFMLAIIGPSGHLKTSLARIFALWLEQEELQEIMFADIARQSELCGRIKELQGLNLIVDDMHAMVNNYRKNKQVDLLDYLSRHCDSRYNLTNILITGEKMPENAIFSSLDRMFPVYISKTVSDRLKALKLNIRELSESFMSQLALEFSCVLKEDSEMVKKDINFFYENYVALGEFEENTRINAHMEALQLVEFLYRKYICNNDEKLSMKKQFEDALRAQASKSYCQLCYQMREESIDYVEVVYDILSSDNLYLKREGIYENYEPTGDNFLLHNRTFYITKTALQKGVLTYLGRAISMRKVSDALHDAGVIEEDCDTRTKKFHGIRHYVIPRQAIELYCEVKKSEEI